MDKRVALIGSGNAFFKDEGVGLYAAKYLKENYTFFPAIEIIDGGTLGFKLMPLLQEYDEVVIVNTASDDTKEAGEISIKATEEFLDGTLIKKTANEVEIAEMLQICALSENTAQTTVISIVPKDIMSVEVALTPELKSAWQDYIDAVIQKIESLGIKATKNEQELTLEEILHIFANPSIEFNRGF